jgi:hypothetical protein
MSYTYLLAAGEESSAESFSAMNLSAPWKSNHTVGNSYSNGNVMESCRTSQSGMMSQLLTGDRGKESPMSSVADSRVRTSPPPEKAQDSAENDLDCGPKCAGSSARYHPATFSWRTAQCSLFGGLERFSATWPRWGIMRHGEFWELVTPKRRTNGNASGSWPTPTVTGCLNGYQQQGKGGVDWKPTIAGAVGAAKTPNPADMTKLYPPRPQDIGGKLNPSWVEWLMGWPVGWTDCTPLETDKFLPWLQKHGKC